MRPRAYVAFVISLLIVLSWCRVEETWSFTVERFLAEVGATGAAVACAELDHDDTLRQWIESGMENVSHVSISWVDGQVNRFAHLGMYLELPLLNGEANCRFVSARGRSKSCDPLLVAPPTRWGPRVRITRDSDLHAALRQIVHGDKVVTNADSGRKPSSSSPLRIFLYPTRADIPASREYGSILRWIRASPMYAELVEDATHLMPPFDTTPLQADPDGTFTSFGNA